MSAVVGTAHSVFTAVAHLEDLTVGHPHGVVIEDRPICVLRTDDEVIAFDDRCPHRGHPLSAASCEPGILRCALHGWEFSLPEGQAISPRAPFELELHEVRIVNDVIEVSL
ncbi:MAG: Rieske (2Fe-2S) protein [Solirubrobacterales bacterium]|nr:Rieske (2Fe-2S) protein [Solirubrobacterales bacterium]